MPATNMTPQTLDITSYLPGGDGKLRTNDPAGQFFNWGLFALGVPHPGNLYGYNNLTIQPPADPSSWPTTEDTFFYYINNETGNDANGNGTPDNPRLTIPEGVTMPAGTVWVLEATSTPYTSAGGPGGTSRFEVTLQGTFDRPCFIVGRNGTPLIDDELRLIATYHTIIDGLEWVKTTNNHLVVHNSAYSEFITIRNCTNTSGTGAPLNGALYSATGISSANKSKGLVIYDCEIANYGENLATSTENDIHAFKPEENFTDIWYINVTCTNMGGDCIQVGSANTPVVDQCERVYIAKNDLSNCLENAIDIKSCRDIIISQNTLYDFNRLGTGGGIDQINAVIIHDDPTNVWCLANTVYNCALGIAITGADGTYLLYNVIYDIDPVMPYNPNSPFGVGYAMSSRASTNVTMALNTVYDYAGGFGAANQQTLDLLSNIFHTRNNALGFDVNYGSSSDYLNGSTDYNCFFPIINAFRSERGSTIEDYPTYKASTGNEANGIIVDPLLNDPANQDFRLQVGSPAYQTGIKPAAIAEFEVLYGINIDFDYLENARGVLASIGAIEEVV